MSSEWVAACICLGLVLGFAAANWLLWTDPVGAGMVVGGVGR